MTSEWSHTEDSQILVATVQNSGATLKFYVARMVTIEDPQILVAIVQNSRAIL